MQGIYLFYVQYSGRGLLNMPSPPKKLASHSRYRVYRDGKSDEERPKKTLKNPEKVSK